MSTSILRTNAPNYVRGTDSIKPGGASWGIESPDHLDIVNHELSAFRPDQWTRESFHTEPYCLVTRYDSLQMRDEPNQLTASGANLWFASDAHEGNFESYRFNPSQLARSTMSPGLNGQIRSGAGLIGGPVIGTHEDWPFARHPDKSANDLDGPPIVFLSDWVYAPIRLFEHTAEGPLSTYPVARPGILASRDLGVPLHEQIVWLLRTIATNIVVLANDPATSPFPSLELDESPNAAVSYEPVLPVAPSTLHPVVAEFQLGMPNELKPNARTVELADQLVRAIGREAVDSEISLDIDGAISFVILLTDKTLITGEFAPMGELFAWHYDGVDRDRQIGDFSSARGISTLLEQLG